MTTTPEKRDERALAVAILTTQGRSQNEIADTIRGTQPEVSRLLTHARTKGYLKQVVSWPSGSPGLRATAEALAYARMGELRSMLNGLAADRGGVPVKRIDVVHAGDRDRYAEFGARASHSLTALLSEARSVAIAWGSVINAIVDAIVQSEVGKRPILTFLPVSGEPLRHLNNGVSPSLAAKRLAAKFDAHALSLQGIPARIPKLISESEANVVRKFLRWSRDYERIFSPPPGQEALIANVDTIVTGIGDAMSSEKDPWFRETMEAEGMAQEGLKKLAVGNLGGVWLHADDAKKKELAKVQAINTRWLGIQAQHFEHCARRAAAQVDRGGVVVVALGPSKAQIVKRAAGMFNHLIIDRTLADAIVGTPSPM